MVKSIFKKEIAAKIALFLVILGFHTFRGFGQPAIGINASTNQIFLSAPSSLNIPPAGLVYPEYTIERSHDLRTWEPVGGKIRGLSGISAPQLTMSLNRETGNNFYRMLVSTNSESSQQTGQGGAEVYGYGSRFSEELGNLGLLSVQAFANNWPQPQYLTQLGWDPTTAQYWTNFNMDPAVWNVTHTTNGHGTRLTDYRLNTNESAIFMTNGFVVSERLSSPSFADSYYHLLTDELPVFVSADSALHAWHRTYSAMLEELEELQMATLLERVLTNMSAQIPGEWQKYGNGPLHDSILDADYYLSVARSLWLGYQVPSSLGQDTHVAATLRDVASLGYYIKYPIFGSNRNIDFSQFQVRGYYANSERLSRYFQAMMWCGRIDLRVATFAPNKENDIRQLGTSVVFNDLLKKSGEFQDWSTMEQITRTFVGMTDSMTFSQLNDLLTAANIQSPSDVPNLLALTNLQTRLLTGELGFQSVRGDAFYSPLSAAQLKLPRSFTICGQKFALDSWAFSQVTYDSILWSPSDGVNVVQGKVYRRKPSCLDIAFSVFGNDQVVPDLVSRIQNNNGVHWRDGLPYQHNLSAVRNVIDSQNAGIWTNNIYTAWIGALRALSAPTTDSKFPRAMRTRAWASKTLNTQLASWTELRHDTLLYVKQSYSGLVLCSYPAGYVEPRPEFWQQMADMATLTASAISNLTLSGWVSTPTRDTTYSYMESYDLQSIKTNQIACLANFAAQMRTLRSIADKELAQQPLSQEETDFLKNIVEQVSAYTASGTRSYNGWYPQLFYRNVFQYNTFGVDEGSDKWDAIVADVHTDPPNPAIGDPGAIIHEGVGHVHLLMVAIDNGPDRMVYAGPVLSHYEFEISGTTRMTDATWQSNLRAGQKPDSPGWTKSYLVPAPYTLPPGY